jgi:hypothetical protein
MNNSSELEKIIAFVKELRPDLSEEQIKEHAMKLMAVPPTHTKGGKRKTHRRRRQHRRKTRHHRK